MLTPGEFFGELAWAGMTPDVIPKQRLADAKAACLRNLLVIAFGRFLLRNVFLPLRSLVSPADVVIQVLDRCDLAHSWPQ